jgi:hypothetical protein
MRTPEPAGHLRDRCARLQQLNPAPSPSLQLLRASLWSHAPRVSRETIVCLLLTHISIRRGDGIYLRGPQAGGATRDEHASTANPCHARSVPMRRLLDAILIVAAAAVVYKLIFP